MPELVHLNNIYEVCKLELLDLRTSIDEYLCNSQSTLKIITQHWLDIVSNDAVALIAFDSFLTCLTNITDLTRKFRINLEMNNLEKSSDRTLLRALEATGAATAADCRSNHFDQQPYNQGPLLPAEENSEDSDADADKRIKAFRPWQHKDLSEYTVGRPLRAFVTYIRDREALRFFALDTECPHLQKIFKLCRMLHLRQYVGLPPEHTVFGVVLDNLIWRAVRRPDAESPPSGERPTTHAAVLLEFGDVVQLGGGDVTYHLPEDYQRIPALAIMCQLESVDLPATPSQQRMQQMLLECDFDTRDFIVQQRNGNVLQLQLKLKLPLHERSGGGAPNQPPPQPVVTNGMNAAEEWDCLNDDPEPSTNPMKLVMGYAPQDDRRLCRFYDPAIQGCFKGANCRLEHTLAQPDGWTKDTQPATTVLDSNQPLVVYSEGSVINITVTHVSSLVAFYAHVNDTKCPMEPNIWIAEDIQPQMMLKKPPLIYDMVLAKYTDGLWYRAKVMEAAGPRNTFTVFYVDYGNTHTIHCHDMARCDYEVAQRPAQALLCRVGHISETSAVEPPLRHKGMTVLNEMLLNRTFDVRVVSHHEDLIIEFVHKKYKRVPETLLTLGLVNGKSLAMRL